MKNSASKYYSRLLLEIYKIAVAVIEGYICNLRSICSVEL